VVDLRLATPVS
jgi:hypothetical protein